MVSVLVFRACLLELWAPPEVEAHHPTGKPLGGDLYGRHLRHLFVQIDFFPNKSNKEAPASGGFLGYRLGLAEDDDAAPCGRQGPQFFGGLGWHDILD